MNIEYLSVTFWFNVLENPQDLKEQLETFFQKEFSELQILEKPLDNYLVPIIKGISDNGYSGMAFSKINFQYNIYHATWDHFKEFKEKVLKLFEFLKDNGVDILHSSIFASGETIQKDALQKVTAKTLASSIYSDDLIDVNLKFGKKHEDTFYKIINLLNKKQIELKGDTRFIPIPLISWYGATLKQELIEVSYELNDKYAFDNEKDYRTTEFYLNKMLYIMANDLQDDLNNLLTKGVF